MNTSFLVATMRVCVAIALSAATGPALADDPYSLNFRLWSGIGFCYDFPPDSDLACSQLAGDGVDYGEFSAIIVWVIVGAVPPDDGESGGIGGIQFGISYDASVDVQGWALCTGGSEIPQDDGAAWPASDTGNAITWAGGCFAEPENPDGLTRVGYFVIAPQSHGRLVFRDDPRTRRAEAADCSATLVPICDELLGAVVLHTDDGPCDDAVGRPCNTCGGDCPVPVRESSWSGIKSRYR